MKLVTAPKLQMEKFVKKSVQEKELRGVKLNVSQVFDRLVHCQYLEKFAMKREVDIFTPVVFPKD